MLECSVYCLLLSCQYPSRKTRYLLPQRFFCGREAQEKIHVVFHVLGRCCRELYNVKASLIFTIIFTCRTGNRKRSSTWLDSSTRGGGGLVDRRRRLHFVTCAMSNIQKSCKYSREYSVLYANIQVIIYVNNSYTFLENE